MGKISLLLVLMLLLAACGSAAPTPDSNALFTVVASTLAAVSSETAASVPPTEAPPTETPEPEATATETPAPTPTQEEGRINLATGATTGVVTGRVEANQRVSFRAGAAANQVIIANLFTPASTAILEIKGADGSTLLADSLRYNSYRTLLTKTQDYEFTVIGGNSAQDFTLSVAFAVPVSFASGTSSATYTGKTVGGNPVTYTIYATAGQHLSVSVNTNASDAALTIWGFNTGEPYARAQNGVTNFNLNLPATQYYIIEVVPQGGRTVDYTLTVSIP
ncbi:MAG: hypothetical protein KIS88_07980 [Anaerolineales bacterium]|nr:hypothetical protein [Anaerolineales bacterium]